MKQNKKTYKNQENFQIQGTSSKTKTTRNKLKNSKKNSSNDKFQLTSGRKFSFASVETDEQ